MTISPISFEDAVMNAPDAFFFGNKDGSFRHVNNEAVLLTGYSINEIKTMLFSDIFTDDSLKNTLLRFDPIFAGKNVIVSRTLLKKDGTKVPVEMHSNMLPDGTLFAIVRDISEKIGYVNSLKESEEKYRTAFLTSPDALSITDMDGKFIEVNNELCNLIGYDLKYIIGRTTSEINIWKNISDRDTYLSELSKNGYLNNFETSLVRKDGEVRTVLMSGNIVSQESKPHILTITRDITEIIKILEALHTAEKLESVGILAGGIAHDFNNILSGIYGFLEIAILENRDPDIAKYLENSRNSLSKAKNLTNQLLTFAEGGNPVKKCRRIYPFVKEVALFVISKENIGISFEIEENLWKCNFDENQLSQAIGSIISNAEHAMPKSGEILIKASNCEITEEKSNFYVTPGKYVKISISDSGSGIPDAVIGKIFDPFFSTKAKGHGLGLATAYSIVKKHKGTINVTSEFGKGTTFDIYIPSADFEVSKIVDKSTSKSKLHSGEGTFIVLDDDPVIRKLLNKMLISMGYTVALSKTGFDTIEIYNRAVEEKHSIAGMIFDLNIPEGIGGKDLVERIRENDKKTPIFVLSGYSSDSVISNPKKYGFTASISKPFMLSELSDMLDNYLGNQSTN